MNRQTEFRVIQMRTDDGWRRNGTQGFGEDVNDAIKAGWVACGGVYQVDTFYRKQVACLAMMRTPPAPSWRVRLPWFINLFHKRKPQFHPDVCQKCGWEHQGIETCHPPREK